MSLCPSGYAISPRSPHMTPTEFQWALSVSPFVCIIFFPCVCGCFLLGVPPHNHYVHSFQEAFMISVSCELLLWVVLDVNAYPHFQWSQISEPETKKFVQNPRKSCPVGKALSKRTCDFLIFTCLLSILFLFDVYNNDGFDLTMLGGLRAFLISKDSKGETFFRTYKSTTHPFYNRCDINLNNLPFTHRA